MTSTTESTGPKKAPAMAYRRQDVIAMTTYQQAIYQMPEPEASMIPPEVPVTGLSIPQLWKAAQGHAKQWDSIRLHLESTCTGLVQFSRLSIALVGEMQRQSEQDFATGKYDSLSREDKLKVQDNMHGIMRRLRDTATLQADQTESVRKTLASYRDAISKDADHAEETRGDYSSWIEEEDATIEAWEKANNAPNSEALLKSFKDQIHDTKEEIKKAEALLAASATGLGIGIVVAPVFPPLAIAGAVGTAIEGISLKKLKKHLSVLRAELLEVRKFNEVKVFFEGIQGSLKTIIDYTHSADAALASLSSSWTGIASSLDRILHGYTGIDSLEPLTGSDWSEPIAMFQAELPIEEYEQLEGEANDFLSKKSVYSIHSMESPDAELETVS